MHPLTTLIESQRNQAHRRPSRPAPRRRQRSPLVATLVLVVLITAVVMLATLALV